MLMPQEVETTLVDLAFAHPNIHIKERYNAVDLILSNEAESPRILGAYVWNRQKSKLKPFERKRLF